MPYDRLQEMSLDDLADEWDSFARYCDARDEATKRAIAAAKKG